MKQINSKNIIHDVAQIEFITTILQVALAFLALSFILMIILYIQNKIKQNKIAKTAQLSRILQDLLSRYIHLNWHEDKSKLQITNKLFNLSTNHYYRTTLVNYIIQLLKLFQGEEKEKLQCLYKDLEFHHEMLQQLKSSSWLKRLNAINELCNMELVEYRSQISELLQDKNYEVKLVAIQAIITIDQHPFRFLLSSELKLNPSQILYITKKASEIKLGNIKEILNLLKSTEHTHILLAIHLAEIYQANEILENFIPFLNHSNMLIKAQTFILLAQLDAQNFHTLLSNFCHYTSHKELTIILCKIHSRYQTPPNHIDQILINALKRDELNQYINYQSTYYSNLSIFC